jgi:hypothetical protein
MFGLARKSPYRFDGRQGCFGTAKFNAAAAASDEVSHERRPRPAHPVGIITPQIHSKLQGSRE